MTGLGEFAIKEAALLSKDIIKNIYSKNDKQKAKWMRYSIIYSPLMMLMLDLHIGLFRTDEKLSFEKRWKKAKPELYKLRFKTFIEKLNEPKFDSEIEIGGLNKFPIDKIQEILNKNSEWADSKLLYLFHWVTKADVEDGLTNTLGRDLLTDAESEFRDYVIEVYEELNKEFIG